MNRKLEIVRDIIKALLSGISFYSLFMFASFIVHTNTQMALYGLLVFPLTITVCFIRRRNPKLPVFIILHLILFAPMFLLSMPLAEKCFFCTILIVLLVNSLRHRSQENLKEYQSLTLALIAIQIAIYLFAFINQYWDLSNITYLCGITYIFLYFAQLYFEHFVEFLYKNDHCDTSPGKRIFVMNSSIVFVIMLLLFITLIVTKLANIDNTFYVLVPIIGKFFVYAILFVFSIFLKLYTLLADSNGAAVDDISFPSVPENDGILQYVIMILDSLLRIALLVFILYVCFRVIRKMIRSILTKYQFTDDEIESLSKSKLKHTKLTKQKASRRERFPNTPEGQIRKRYYKTVRAQRKAIGLTATKTTTDIKDAFASELQEDLTELTDQYEAARYHPNEY